MVRAIDDFLAVFPAGRERYLAELRRLALSLYREAAGGRRYFLEKTPRYHLVLDELLTLFPEARFVFLWRQPLAVAASMIDSFGGGRWNLHKYWIDLYDGLATLVDAYRPDDPRMHALRYEDLVRRPEAELARLHAFLDLGHEAPRALSATQLRGRMGDHAGTARYHDVSEASLERWRATMASPLRRRWCRHYLAWLGPARLAAMGYDASTVAAELERLPARRERLASDALRIAHGYAYTSVRRRVSHGRRRGLGGEPA